MIVRRKKKDRHYVTFITSGVVKKRLEDRAVEMSKSRSYLIDTLVKIGLHLSEDELTELAIAASLRSQQAALATAP